VLFASSKNVLSEIFEASFGESLLPPIADVNSKYVFYEIHLNKPEYDYIVQNSLYSKDGQTAFLAQPNATISFPEGSNSAQSYGAIEVKAAWKQLGPGDDATKFYTVVATLIDPVTGDQIPDVTIGLVGLHIITRTPQWVWSTFEHVANAPDAPPPPPQSVWSTPEYAFDAPDAALAAPPTGSQFNFNDLTQPLSPTGYGYQPGNTPVANPKPTQITRVLNNVCINGAWTQARTQRCRGSSRGPSGPITAW
jgi:hypothetical protein